MTVTAMARQSHRMAPRSDEHTREALRDHRDAARRSEPQRRDSTTTVWRARLEGSQVVHDFDTDRPPRLQRLAAYRRLHPIAGTYA